MFLDIDMPGLDGWLLCEILHKVDRWAHIPIILQSALVGEENIKRGLSLGARSYIEKPFTEISYVRFSSVTYRRKKMKQQQMIRWSLASSGAEPRAGNGSGTKPRYRNPSHSWSG